MISSWLRERLTGLSLAQAFIVFTGSLVFLTSLTIALSVIRTVQRHEEERLLARGRNLAAILAQNAEYALYTEDPISLAPLLSVVDIDEDAAYVSFIATGQGGARTIASRAKAGRSVGGPGFLEIEAPMERKDLEQIVPFPVARGLVLEAPADIVLYECVCRHARKAHCEPTQVCMVIGKPMSDFVLSHQTQKARRIGTEEAVAVLEAEHARGHVHSAWFKDAMLGRFYAICNCCSCCCGGLAAMRSGVRMVASSGFVAKIDRELCVDCGDCADACPFGALARTEGTVEREWERCMGCGVCESRCAPGAIRLERDPRKGVPLDVRALA